jgi:ketose-bisphosphate aldolase
MNDTRSQTGKEPMNVDVRPENVITLREVLGEAQRGGYAVGSFSPRHTPMIRAVLGAGQKARSPLIVQISHKEALRYGISPDEFVRAFYEALVKEDVTVPTVLHLDHTKDVTFIEEAIAAGFTSVMIDASEKPLEENAAITREVVAYAHARGVSVEAELGEIGASDDVETDASREAFTDPEEAAFFARETGVDALAVSVGTVHGVYLTREPRIDFERLVRIRERTAVPLVLHGGSGVPPEMLERAISIPGGGVSKVNIATDLELSLLKALGREERMTDPECRALPSEELEKAALAVAGTVGEKIRGFLKSAGRADRAAT